MRYRSRDRTNSNWQPRCIRTEECNVSPSMKKGRGSLHDWSSKNDIDEEFDLGFVIRLTWSNVRGRMKLWEGGGVQVGWSRVERAGTEGVKKKSPLLAWSGPEWTRAIRDHPECQGSSLARGNQVPLECDPALTVKKGRFHAANCLRLVLEILVYENCPYRSPKQAFLFKIGFVDHHVPGVRHERGKRLWFDVSDVPPGEHIIGAELRLYRSIDVKSRRNRGSYMITAYRVLRSEDGSRELQYVDAINTTIGREGWLTLNVSEPLSHWVNNPNGNRGLYLSVHPADRSVHEMRPEDIGIVGFKGDPDKLPFMVGYFKSSGIRESKVRQKRDARRRKKSESSSLDYRNNPYTDPGSQYNSRTCKIQTLYVSFRDLQWQDWIIAPDGYDAYYCSGECNFPLNAHMNATNHAIVQTLVHLVSPGKVPKPCCAPTKLSAISVLYFLDESNVILKKYKNMVVKSCGCH
uniref:TGF-beta family profile domain-containing protein n=1 Tax=Vespula pensylvanica TaxID=30213 RepID=A0A834UC96_VESPE|nr:hypothetical protein H0235_006524 [Vespula pensylvanica]